MSEWKVGWKDLCIEGDYSKQLLSACVMFLKNSMNTETTVYKFRILWKIIGLMVQKLAGTPTWPVAAFPHSSSLSFHSLFHAPNQAAACSSVKLKMSLSMQSQQPAIDGCSLDHTYKLCWLASSRTGRPALAQNKSKSLQITSSIHCSLSEGSTHQIAHEEGVTLFDCTTMLPSI